MKQVSTISEKNLPDEETKASKNIIECKNLVKQKAYKGNTVAIQNKSHYILKLNRILDDFSNFKRFQVEEGKALNHKIHGRTNNWRIERSSKSV